MSDVAKTSASAKPLPLQSFFTGFSIPGFTYNPGSSPHRNFARLCKVSGWMSNTPQRTEAHRGFQDALVQQFNFYYGVDSKNLTGWQNLCRTIGIEPIPDTIQQCRKHVWDAHVNIVDLIEANRLSRPVQRFRTLNELANYTRKTGYFFPRDNAYQGGLLKELLREIVGHYFGSKRNRSQKGGERKGRKQVTVAAPSKS